MACWPTVLSAMVPSNGSVRLERLDHRSGHVAWCREVALLCWSEQQQMVVFEGRGGGPSRAEVLLGDGDPMKAWWRRSTATTSASPLWAVVLSRPAARSSSSAVPSVGLLVRSVAIRSERQEHHRCPITSASRFIALTTLLHRRFPDRTILTNWSNEVLS